MSCAKCGGTGEVKVMTSYSFGLPEGGPDDVEIDQPCPACGRAAWDDNSVGFRNGYLSALEDVELAVSRLKQAALDEHDNP